MRYFLKESSVALKNLVDHGMITEEEHLKLMEQRLDILDDSQADALEWARTRQISDESKERLESMLARKLESPFFVPPPHAKEKNFLVYRGDGELSLKIPKSLEHLLFYEKTTDQAGNEVTRVSFETTLWKPK